MKMKLLLPALMLLSLASCVSEPVIRTGDLLFIASEESSSTGMDGAIVAATGSSDSQSYVHVAVLEVVDGSIWVIDATPKRGVDRHPLDTLLADFKSEDGRLPGMTVMRLKDSSRAEEFVRNAKALTGSGYDFAFLPDNDAYYCSELVRESYVDEKGNFVFGTVPMNFKASDGSFPEYWQKLFSRLGIEIPQGIPGTNPQAMSEEEVLVPVMQGAQNLLILHQ